MCVCACLLKIKRKIAMDSCAAPAQYEAFLTSIDSHKVEYHEYHQHCGYNTNSVERRRDKQRAKVTSPTKFFNASKNNVAAHHETDFRFCYLFFFSFVSTSLCKSRKQGGDRRKERNQLDERMARKRPVSFAFPHSKLLTVKQEQQLPRQRYFFFRDALRRTTAFSIPP